MSDKQIDAFNDWYKKNINQEGAFLGCKTVFRSEHAVIAAKAWQAAIASVVVDIKNLPSASYTSSGVVYLSDVAETIEKAGVKHNDE